MFDRCGDIVGLDACGQCCPHLTEMIRVFPIGFLRAAPSWMAQQIDAHRAGKIAILGADFLAHSLANALFQVAVPTCAAGHRCGETR